MKLLQSNYKCLFHKEFLPEIFHNYFASVQSVHCHSTRRNVDLFITREKSNIGQGCSIYSGSYLYLQI